MMTPRTLTGLAVALVALGALAWGTSQKRYSTVEDGGFEKLLATPIDAGAVQSVRAWLGSSPDSVVNLTREGDGWVVAADWSWPAKGDLVDKLLTDLGELRGERRSSSADVLDDYQIGENTGLHLVGTGAGGSELFHVIAGKQAARGGSFIRRSDSNDVFITSTGLRASFGVWGEEPAAPDAKRWMNLRVHQADRQDVDRISLQDAGKEIVLEKEFAAPADSAGMVDRADWTWKADASGAFDKGKVDGILGTLCSLYASEAVPPDAENEYGLADSNRKVQIAFADGHTVTVAFGNTLEEDAKTYFQVDDGPPALIYDSTVERIFQSRNDLKPTET